MCRDNGRREAHCRRYPPPARRSGDLPLKTFCTIPSCVPAAPGFEDSGAVIDAADIETALEWDDVIALGEMMNYPGVVSGDDDVHDKLAATYETNKRATGHFASRDTGAELDAFIAAGISSCHESIRKEEVLARLRRGMWTMLRQGSAWKDIPETIKAVTETDVDTRHLLLVSDDTHPDTITEKGHLDRVLRVAISNGLDPVTAIQAVTLNAAEYYGVDADLGALSPGKMADVVFLDDLATVDVSRVMVDGSMVVADGEWIDDGALPAESDHTAAVHDAFPEWARDTVKLDPQPPAAFEIPAPDGASEVSAEVVRVHENQVVTSRESATLPVEDGAVAPDGDVSKAAVLERHGGDGGRSRLRHRLRIRRRGGCLDGRSRQPQPARRRDRRRGDGAGGRADDRTRRRDGRRRRRRRPRGGTPSRRRTDERPPAVRGVRTRPRPRRRLGDDRL